jgi:hypothetical protein
MIKIYKIGDSHSEVLLLNKMALKIRKICKQTHKHDKCKWNDKPALIWQEQEVNPEHARIWIGLAKLH